MAGRCHQATCVVAAAWVVIALGCQRFVAPGAGSFEGAASQTTSEQAASRDREALPLPAQTPQIAQAAFVLNAVLVRHAPTLGRWLPASGRGSKKSNAMTTLYRGEAVRVRANRQGFADVTLSDESHGWVQENTLLVGEQLQLATVIGRTRLFLRPDMLALHGSRIVLPGTLLIEIRQKDLFSLVNYNGQECAWVLTAMLHHDAEEVGAAKLLHRARLLQKNQEEDTLAIIELLRGQYANTRVFAALSEKASLPQEEQEAWVPAAKESVDSSTAAEAPSLQLTPPPLQQAPATQGAPGLQNWQPPVEANATVLPQAPAPTQDGDAFDEAEEP